MSGRAFAHPSAGSMPRPSAASLAKRRANDDDCSHQLARHRACAHQAKPGHERARRTATRRQLYEQACNRTTSNACPSGKASPTETVQPHADARATRPRHATERRRTESRTLPHALCGTLARESGETFRAAEVADAQLSEPAHQGPWARAAPRARPGLTPPHCSRGSNTTTPEIGGDQTHIFFELGDHLGSTNIVIDKVTGELVERGTYQAYGVTESDYRPGRWEHFREDYKFTGKEEDIEVGLQYFGKRFLSAHLQRWVSADPLEVHGIGSGDPNVYAYVSGQALKTIDPLGLSSMDSGVKSESPNEMNCQGQCSGPSSATQQPVRTKPPPAPAPSPSQALKMAEAYAEHTINQLKNGAMAMMPGTQSAAELSGKVDAAQQMHTAAKAGDIGGALKHGFKLTPAGQTHQMVKGLGERLGGSAHGFRLSLKTGDPVGATVSGLEFKRAGEEGGLMVAGVPGMIRMNFLKSRMNPTANPRNPTRRIYEHNPKHRDAPYRDSKGRIVSRRPRGDCQAMLDCSVQKGTGSGRIGVEPSTGKTVEFKRHHVLKLAEETLEFFHGFVPE